eukprot:11777793-Alexandrium_andersonii.AAC.1
MGRFGPDSSAWPGPRSPQQFGRLARCFWSCTPAMLGPLRHGGSRGLGPSVLSCRRAVSYTHLRAHETSAHL